MSDPFDNPRLTGPRRGFRMTLGGPLGTVVGVVAGAVGLVAAFALSIVLFSVLLVAGVVFGGWFWWKTRDLRRALDAAAARRSSPLEREVQGEAIVVSETGGERQAR
ncbi:MAG: hypothetical protein U1F10_14350 [Burkholderiales bacterium]